MIDHGIFIKLFLDWFQLPNGIDVLADLELIFTRSFGRRPRIKFKEGKVEPCSHYHFGITTLKKRLSLDDSERPSFESPKRMEWCDHIQSIFPKTSLPQHVPCGGKKERCMLAWIK